ncbi:MAG: HAMP domain-containing histidine kinase [Bryobacterales bacterium]|nr:HAMP domain-containing histidine kinase [Acidobacteriota bacterium]MCB9383953.1 HAMP domain-containing histidine kinase [Bryobacterales bacterium]
MQLRFLLAAGEVALLFFSADAANVRALWSFCGTAIASQVASNVWLARFARRERRGSEHVLGAVFGLDAVVLTVVFAFAGGPTNPFTLLYLVQITLSAVILHKTWTWALGLLSTICYGLLFLFSTAISSHSGHAISEAMSRHVTGMWFAFALAAGALTFFIGQVSETLQNRQREVLELQRQVARQERLASLVTLAGGAAHEMGTPLGTIAVAAREIERAAEIRSDAASVAEDARLIRSQVDRCRAILADMSAKGAEPFGESPAPVRLGSIFESVADELPRLAKGRLRADFSLPQEIWTYPASVTQSLVALVKNGLDASPNGEPVTLTAEVGESAVTFLVCDRGEGMDAETLAHVAEPFFTRKPQGEGMGLGAFLVHLFATRVAGDLRYESAVGRGTTAFLRLPLSGRRG